MKHLKGNIILIITAVIWGFAFAFQSVAMDKIGPCTFLAARSLVGGIFLVPCVYIINFFNTDTKKNEKNFNKKELIIASTICGIIIFAASLVQQVGIIYTSVGKSGFITALYIVIVPILGIALKKKAGLKVWFSVLLSGIGLYFLCINESFSINIGDILTLICAFLFSIDILVVDYFSKRVNGVKMSCIQFLVCGFISLVVAFIFEKPEISQLIQAVIPILYAGVLSSGVGYTFQIIAQKDTSPVVASLIMSLESVFSVIGGFLILGETLTEKEITGCILMFSAIILSQIPDIKLKVISKNKKLS
ncbi:DMT family transporter [Clostridium sp. BJN0001]|uniref:DMT family transporter n=1 Tax=Clostridium sp. BJN0001 TaxID=2930219 RepID=UPI001FD03BFA|nr:DMT family transporter [Clostridium sp. BJN0001]